MMLSTSSWKYKEYWESHWIRILSIWESHGIKYFVWNRQAFRIANISSTGIKSKLNLQVKNTKTIYIHRRQTYNLFVQSLEAGIKVASFSFLFQGDYK